MNVIFDVIFVILRAYECLKPSLMFINENAVVQAKNFNPVESNFRILFINVNCFPHKIQTTLSQMVLTRNYVFHKCLRWYSRIKLQGPVVQNERRR